MAIIYTPYDKTFQNIKDKIVEIPYFKCYTVKWIYFMYEEDYIMARGRKKETRTLDEQLQAVIGEIATYEEKLKELRRRKKEIEQKITEDKKEALYKAVMESGKSLDEVLASLTNE